MDSVLREASMLLEAPMAVVRFGFGQIINQSIKHGDILVPTMGASFVSENYDYDPQRDSPDNAFYISKPIPGSDQLNAILFDKMVDVFTDKKVHKGLMISSDYFYGFNSNLYIYIYICV